MSRTPLFMVAVLLLGTSAIVTASPAVDVGLPCALAAPTERTASIWDGAGHAFVFGGDLGSGALNTIYKFTPGTGLFEPSGLLPRPMSGPSAVWDGAGHVFLFGGYDGTKFLSTVYRYTLSTEVFELLDARLPTARDGTSAVWDGAGHVYIFGGHDNAGTPGGRTDEVLRFTVATETIEVMPVRLPSGRGETSAVWDGQGHAYIFGGIGQLPWRRNSEIVRYTPDEQTMEIVSAHLPVDITWTSAIWTGEQAYVFGGQNPAGQSVTTVTRYDPATGKAQQVEGLPSPGRERTSAVWDGAGNAYIIGGKDDATGMALGEVVRYRPGEGFISGPCRPAVPQPVRVLRDALAGELLSIDVSPLAALHIECIKACVLDEVAHVAERLDGLEVTGPSDSGKPGGLLPAIDSGLLPAAPEAVMYMAVEPSQGSVRGETRIRIEMQAVQPDETLSVHYFDGAGWVDLGELPDGGIVPGATPDDDLRVFASGYDAGSGTAWAVVDHTSLYSLARSVKPPAPSSGMPSGATAQASDGGQQALLPLLVAGAVLAGAVLATLGAVGVSMYRSRRRRLR